MIQEFNADGKTECGHLADITKNNKYIYREETKTNKRQFPLSPVQVQDP